MSLFQRNYFHCPNDIVDESLLQMSHPALKCYLVILRKTKGWQKEKDRIAKSQFELLTGLKKTAIYEALIWLEENGFICRSKGRNQSEIPEYWIKDEADSLSAEAEGDASAVRQSGDRCPSERNALSARAEQQNKLNTKQTNTKEVRENLQRLLTRPDNFLILEIPDIAKDTFKKLKADYRENGGEVSNVKRCEMLYYRRVWIPDQEKTFLHSLQNLLNFRANQGTRVPDLSKYIESMDWEDNADHWVEGGIKLDGVPVNHKYPSTEKPCTKCGCNTDGKFSDHEGRCFECANGIPK